MEALDVLMSVAESELNLDDRQFEQSSLFTDESMIEVSLDDLRLEADKLLRKIQYETRRVEQPKHQAPYDSFEEPPRHTFTFKDFN